jgi:predicted DNA-binding protein
MASMTQITARLPDAVVESLDEAAKELRKSRADIVRAAVELYLAEFEDLAVAVSRLRDLSDPVLDWAEIRGDLLAEDQR